MVVGRRGYMKPMAQFTVCMCCQSRRDTPVIPSPLLALHWILLQTLDISPSPVWSPSSHCNTHHRRKYFLGEKYLLAAADRVTGGPRGRCLLTIKMRYRHWSGTSDSAAQWRPSPVSIYPVRQWQVTLDFLLFSHICLAAMVGLPPLDAHL